MEFFDTIRQVQTNWQPYKKWDIEQQKKENQNDELRKKYPPTPEELEHAKQYGRTIVDVINTMDQHSIDKSEDASLVVLTYGKMFDVASLALFFPLQKLLQKLPIMKKNPELNKFSWIASLFILSTFVTSTIQILQAKYEKQASRIARYQTREKDLKDYRHFVVYNKEQIEKAKEIAQTLPEVNENKKPFKKGYHPIYDYKNAKKTTDLLRADNKNYEDWKKEYEKKEKLKLEKFKALNPSQKELGKAEKDKESLLGTIKKVESYSLDYLNNVSMTISIAMAGLSLGTVLGVQGLNTILDKCQSKSKILQKKSKTLFLIKTLDIIIVPMIVPIYLLGKIVKLQKDAARVGRFKAKQDLLNNPEKFISYSDEKRKEVANKKTKSQKNNGFFKKVVNDFKELKKYQKDYNEHKLYINTTHKEELKLDEALKNIKITDKQKQDAIQLQKKAFHSFEKMDEKAQRFTDDTDAAVDIMNSTFIGMIKMTLDIWGLINLAKLSKKGVNTANVKSDKILKKMMPFIISLFINPIGSIIGTRIKKDAGKIGVMSAIKDLDPPKNFLDDDEVKE